jgi:hypothetical protein
MLVMGISNALVNAEAGKLKRCKVQLNETSKQIREIVMISSSASLSTTSSMRGHPTNRGVPPIIPYTMASFHLLSIFLLQVGTNFTTYSLIS